MSYLREKLPGQDPDTQDILKKHEPIGLGFLTGSVTEMITKLDQAYHLYFVYSLSRFGVYKQFVATREDLAFTD